jgi:RNA polymerase sigma-70 factor (ECF subfamily)
MAGHEAAGTPSAEDLAFRDLIRRVRVGDQDAAAELVRQYEPEIRRAVRLRLNDPKLMRVLDSMDVCQSVMGRFFVGAAAGQFDLEHPAQLFKLLVTMAKNRVIDHARKPANRPELLAGDSSANRLPGRVESPSVIVSHKELLAEVRKRLSEDERKLAELRAAGLDWAEVARRMGGSAEALRKKLERAMERVTRELGIE